LLECGPIIYADVCIIRVLSSLSSSYGAATSQVLAIYENFQDFAFSNIEKFSTASLVTRLTNDVNNMQMTLMMGMRLLVRAPVMLVAALVLRSTVWKDNVVAGAWMMVLVGAVGLTGWNLREIKLAKGG